ncbi:DUF1015 domain-containing protein [Streptomyces carpaticus]|uniref:DUF1015 domain-containing protein n=1 Tax=Streptomyces carpaticus TaxID=285558 RepID=UPI0021FA1C2B|nr:DUF1015 domain-containing protein [Streptomyces carpaticus]
MVPDAPAARTGPGPGPGPEGLDLAPFRGLRYVPGRVGDPAAVTSPPYDVVVRPDGLHELETADPYNIVRLILPQAADPAEGHRRAARTLRRWRAEGVLRQDPRPALYVYEQRGPAPGSRQRGVIGALSLTAPGDGTVLPHEDVMPDVVADRAALTRATAANLEPLLLSYRAEHPDDADHVIDAATRTAPLLATRTGDGIAHRLWAVTDHAALTRLRAALHRHRALISDGHHRWATSLRLRDEHAGRPPWDRAMVLLVNTARYPLRVQAIHRVLPQLPADRALERVRATAAFRVRRLSAPLDDALRTLDAAPGPAFLLSGREPGALHLLDRPDPALLDRTVPAGRPAAWRALDATVLHTTLLRAVWRIPDEPGSIRYLHDTASALAQAERADGTAVLLRPVAEETVRALAEAGVMMPRKSTSFGPKPASGLVIRPLEEGPVAPEN